MTNGWTSAGSNSVFTNRSWILLLSTMVLLFGACGSTIRTYEGPPLPANQTALMRIRTNSFDSGAKTESDSAFWVTHIDGKFIPRGGPLDWVELSAPGEHSVTFAYFEMTMTELLTFSRTASPVTVKFMAEPGRKYGISPGRKGNKWSPSVYLLRD